MRNRLIQYVDLLFAGAPQAQDIKTEILQNTLDRYDDLIAQGKSPEAAYSLAITGIGDISELLPSEEPTPAAPATPVSAPETAEKPLWKKIMIGIAIFLYIISLIPLLVIPHSLGLVGTIAIAAVATFFVILGSGGGKRVKKEAAFPKNPDQELRDSIFKVVNISGLCMYLLISFLSDAWYITWLIFPILAAIRGLINAIMDMKGVRKYDE